LARNRTELIAQNKRLWHIPHHYQKYCGRFGSDIRVYVVGGKSVAAVRRDNTDDFRANAGLGGKVTILADTNEYIKVAEQAAKIIDLDYCAVDFAADTDGVILLEVNSNAYFEVAEKATGINIAGAYIEYIKSQY